MIYLLLSSIIFLLNVYKLFLSFTKINNYKRINYFFLLFYILRFSINLYLFANSLILTLLNIVLEKIKIFSFINLISYLLDVDLQEFISICSINILHFQISL